MKTSLASLARLALGFCCLPVAAALAAGALAPDLNKLSEGIGGKPADKVQLTWKADAKGKPALFATGIVWLDGVDFREGTIECDILGQSAPRGSNFPGIVFHAVDAATYDCVYFRPFNFRAENPESSAHAVQYVAPPQWPWQKLRAERTKQYEKPIVPPPDGDAWFRARIVIEGRTISVFVNDAAKPSLVVEKLNDRTSGKFGITGGDAGVGGHFANLKITPKKP